MFGRSGGLVYLAMEAVYTLRSLPQTPRLGLFDFSLSDGGAIWGWDRQIYFPWRKHENEHFMPAA